MSYSTKKAKELFDLVELHGKEEVASMYGIDIESVSRACRVYRQNTGQAREPKILLLDIETLPMHVRVWGLYKQRIPIKNILKDWIVLSWAAKWLCAPGVMSDILTPKECKDRSDLRICKSIYQLLDEADIVIAHNLKRFDIRKLRSRFIINGFQPYSPVQLLDTLTESRRNFAHSSHKLDWIGALVRNEGKIDTDYQLWIDCENGIKKALEYMLGYNIEDVQLLEEAYLWMRPWMTSHPNLALYRDSDGITCGNCGGTNLKKRKYQYTKVNRYNSYQCKDCGAYRRGRKSDVDKDERERVLA